MQKRKKKKSETRDEPERVFQVVALDPCAETWGSTEWRRRKCRREHEWRKTGDFHIPANFQFPVKFRQYLEEKKTRVLTTHSLCVGCNCNARVIYH